MMQCSKYSIWGKGLRDIEWINYVPCLRKSITLMDKYTGGGTVFHLHILSGDM